MQLPFELLILHIEKHNLPFLLLASLLEGLDFRVEACPLQLDIIYYVAFDSPSHFQHRCRLEVIQDPVLLLVCIILAYRSIFSH